jgi:hypothetical protein
MDHARAVARLCGVVMIAGGVLFCISSDFTVFPYALLLCMLGLALAVQIPDRYHASWSKQIGRLFLAGALIGALAGIIGQYSSAIVFSTQRYSETGNLIDVTNYPISYFTDRYGSVSAFLLLGLGLFFLACVIPTDRVGLAAQRMLILLAVLSLLIYLAGVIDVYLDGETPGILVAVLWRVFGFGWIIVGALYVVARQVRSTKGWLHVS